MAKIISSSDDAVCGIEKYNTELEKSEGLQDRLAYVRGWYAVKTENGWAFGPSKFIGYLNLSADQYLEGRLDGRKTEAQLNKWFQVVDESTDLYSELYDALVEFLEAFGKEPSRATRISVVDSNWNDRLNDSDQADHNSKLVELIIEVARSLPAPHLRELRNKICA